jgi:hypothetical protein
MLSYKRVILYLFLSKYEFLKENNRFINFNKTFYGKSRNQFCVDINNLLLIIKLFVTKVVMNPYKIFLDLLIHLKVFVAKLILTFVEITVNLCSKMGKAVMYLLIMSTKMRRFRSLNKFIRLIVFLTLFY